MLPAYQTWIKNYLARHNGAVLGRCRDATEEMQRDFPELRIRKGHIYDLSWGQRGHWWLETSDGEIVDPTASQFPALMEYEEWKPGRPVRVGKCMNCGKDIWEKVETLDEEPRRRSSCSHECETELLREYG